MTFRPTLGRLAMLLAAAVPLAMSGCGSGIGDALSELRKLEINIDNSVNSIQTEDPRTIVIDDAPGRGDTVIIDSDATVIVDIETQLVVSELPDITLVGIENLTSFDIYIRYQVDGDVQGVFVLQGDTLLLEYPCVGEIQLLTEDDFDVVTGDFVDSFDISDTDLLNPEDFVCGEAVIMSIDDFGVATHFETIDLTP